MRPTPPETLATFVANPTAKKFPPSLSFSECIRGTLQRRRRRPVTQLTVRSSSASSSSSAFLLLLLILSASLPPTLKLSLPAASDVIDGPVHTLTGWSYRASCKGRELPLMRRSTSQYRNVIRFSLPDPLILASSSSRERSP